MKLIFIMSMLMFHASCKKIETGPSIPDGDGFTNANALDGIATDFAAAKAGTINIKMIQLGDSNIEYGGNNAHSWRTVLNANGYSIKGSQWSNIFGVQNPFSNFRNWFGVGWSDISDWVDESSIPNSNGNSVTLYTNKSQASTVEPFIAINYAGPGASGNVMEVYYKAQTGGGTIQLRKNISGATDLASYATAGDSWANIDTSDTTGADPTGLKIVTLDATGVSSFGVLPIHGTNGVEIYGLQLYDTGSKGIHFISLGHSGSGAAQFANKITTALWQAQFAEVAKTLATGDKAYVFWNLGTNDFRSFTINSTQYKDFMETNILEIQSQLPAAKIILQGPPAHDYGSFGGDNTRRLEFCTKLIELAAEYNCVYWDLDHIISSDFATYSDGLHWTLEGNTALANSFITKFGL